MPEKPERSKSSEGLTSEMSVPETTKAAIEILHKWSSEKGNGTVDSQDAYAAALDIAKMTIQEQRGSSKTFDMAHALNDIVKLVTKETTPQEGDDCIVPEYPEVFTLPEGMRVGSRQITKTPSPRPGLDVKPRLKSSLFEVEKKWVDCGCNTGSLYSVQSSPYSERGRQFSDLIHCLVMQLIERLPQRHKISLNLDEVYNFIEDLNHKAPVELIRPLLDSVKNLDRFKEVINAVVRDIFRVFRSPATLAEALLSPDDPTLSDAIYKYLMIHLRDQKHDRPKSKIFRACSCVCKVLFKPFEVFCQCNTT